MVKTLSSVDLFSGIGGMQHALRGICKPFLYCDIDPFARAVLRRNMAAKRLPTAPILEDVRDSASILRVVDGRHVDVMIATSSCKGFSHVGPLTGLQHVESKIILATLHLVEKLQPSVIFMENVPGILTTNGGKDFKHLQRHFEGFGYSMRYAVYSASSLGAPHVRKRWYAVCVKHDDAGIQRVLKVLQSRRRTQVFRWTSDNEPRLHIKTVEPWTRQRISALGNAVVPDCARLAFIELLTSQRLIDHDDSRGARSIVLKAALVPTKVPGRTIATPVLKEATLRFFPTPRYKNISSCATLTQRCTRDLGTVIRFWKDARGKRNAEGAFTNPQFIEYMMGFPRDWTKVHDSHLA